MYSPLPHERQVVRCLPGHFSNLSAHIAFELHKTDNDPECFACSGSSQSETYFTLQLIADNLSDVRELFLCLGRQSYVWEFRELADSGNASQQEPSECATRAVKAVTVCACAVHIGNLKQLELLLITQRLTMDTIRAAINPQLLVQNGLPELIVAMEAFGNAVQNVYDWHSSSDHRQKVFALAAKHFQQEYLRLTEKKAASMIPEPEQPSEDAACFLQRLLAGSRATV